MAGADAVLSVRPRIGAPSSRKNEGIGESGQAGEQIDCWGSEAIYLGARFRIGQPRATPLEVDE
jgi:hypothetical protein